MRPVILMLALLFLPAHSVLAANATVKDGATLQIAGVTYRLDGVDAPEFDQVCSTIMPIPGPAASKRATSWQN